MASRADNIASTLNLANFSKATELKSRIWFTVGALIVFRFLSFVPLPGINPLILESLASKTQGGILDIFNAFSGGSLQRMSLIALGVMPYITASIVVQLGASLHPALTALKKEGESGRKKLNQYTRYGAVFLTAIQGWFLATGLEAFGASSGLQAVIDPGYVFRVGAVISLIGGIFICFFERASRRLLVQYPKRVTQRGMMAADRSHLPLKLNTAGVIPPIFASSLLLLPLTITQFAGRSVSPDSTMGQVIVGLNQYLGHGKPVYMVLYALGIVFFSFFYTAVVFNPEETADNLKRNGGFIPGIRPGKSTANYLDYVLTRITVLGAAYITVVCVVPEAIMAETGMGSLFFGGTSLLIVVNVTVDTITQIQSHLLAHQYGDLIKKAKLKGRMR